LDRGTIEKAFIAGEVGKAIYKESDRYFLIDASEDAEPVWCRLGDVGLITDSAVEVTEVSRRGLDLNGIRRALAHEKTAQNALTLTLGGLDEDLSLETRATFIDASEQALQDRDAYTFVRNRLLSWPLPEGADKVGAIEVSSRIGAKGLEGLYAEVKASQGAIKEVTRIWRQLARESFQFENELMDAEYALVSGGFFSDLVAALVSGDDNMLEHAYFQIVSSVIQRLGRAEFARFSKNQQDIKSPDKLTPNDATFLYFEKKEAPMHIGSVSVFEGEIPFDKFVENVNSKLHLIPRYRQKVVPDPFMLGHPTWEFDSEFDISRHIFRVDIDPPGSEAELVKLAGKIFTPVMDRGKPLWDIYLVYGLKGKRSAMIARVHHCMVDGVSGVDLLKVVLDISPNPQPVKSELTPPPPQPDAMRRVFDSPLGGIQKDMNRWMEFPNGLMNLTLMLTNEQMAGAAQQLAALLPALASPAPLLPFNRPCSGERKLVWSEFSFAEARAIRGACGGTVNDVVLTVLSGAVSRYAEMHGQNTEGRNLRVMVPVSIRQEDRPGALGNLVSLITVEIPLGLKEPLERFRHVNQKTAAMKAARVAESINLMSALMGILPAPVQPLVGALANTPLPVFNIVSTNVPGPQVPLYAMGKQMVAYYPYVPVGYAMGVGCAVMSYDQKLYFGLTSDVQAMPDVERLKQFLEESFVELREAAGVPEIQLKKMKRGRRAGR
jgi:diacylglycerol O-acyltransferase